MIFCRPLFGFYIFLVGHVFFSEFLINFFNFYIICNSCSNRNNEYTIDYMYSIKKYCPKYKTNLTCVRVTISNDYIELF